MKYCVHSRLQQRLKGFTLIELLVVIAIIAILAAILFPVFARARGNACRASCQSNAKQILLGIAQYTQDFDEKYIPMCTNPPVVYWPKILEPYLKSTQIYNCSSATGTHYTDITSYYPYYGFNTHLFELNGGNQGRALSSISQPAETVLLADSGTIIGNPRVNPQGYSLVPAYNSLANYVQYRHLKTANVGFLTAMSRRCAGVRLKLWARAKTIAVQSPLLTITDSCSGTRINILAGRLRL